MSPTAKVSPKLAPLIDPDSFREIWCKTTWLGDEFELRRDHYVLRELLRAASSAGAGREMQPALQLAMDLFKLHLALEHQLLGVPQLRAPTEHALVLIEQLEDADPDDPINLALATDLQQRLELLTSLEEDCYGRLCGRSSASLLDGELLQLRQQLLRDAERLLRAGGATPDPGQRPN
ncbi:MAG: hypothetical protein AB1651_08950 [Pseudomonadota bacterium]